MLFLDQWPPLQNNQIPPKRKMLDSKFMISILKLKQIEFDLSKLTSRLALYIQSLDLFNIYFNTLIDKRNAKTYHRWPVQGRGSERQCGAKQELSPK